MIAPSLTKINRGKAGVSMTTTWLIRLDVRKAGSATTARMKSSVCSDPFINTSTSPRRTNSTATRADSSASSAATIEQLSKEIPARRAVSSIAARGPTRTACTNAQAS